MTVDWAIVTKDRPPRSMVRTMFPRVRTWFKTMPYLGIATMKCLAGTMGTMGTMVYIDTLGIVVVQ